MNIVSLQASGERNGLKGMLVLVVVLIFAIYFAANSTSEPSKNVALGVIGSLIASLVFAYVSEFVDTPSSREANRLSSVIDRAEARETEQAERLEVGVVSVRAKYQFSPEFWFDFVGGATTRLDIVGHVLSGWTGPEMREQFGQNVLRILKAGGRVRIVLMRPGGTAMERLQRMGRDYAATVDLLHLEVVRLVETEGELANGLEILHSDDDLTYMMVDGGGDVLISPYMTARKAEHPLLLRLSGGSSFAAGYRSDFERIVARAGGSVSVRH